MRGGFIFQSVASCLKMATTSHFFVGSDFSFAFWCESFSVQFFVCADMFMEFDENNSGDIGMNLIIWCWYEASEAMSSSSSSSSSKGYSTQI